MEKEILRRLAEEELYENASIESFSTHASRIRAAAAAAQPAAFAILNSVRGRGGGAGGPPSLFPGAGQPAPPGGPSIYDMALMQQRLALDEQSRMRAMAQAAAAMRQQQQRSQLSQLSQFHQQQHQRSLQEQQQRALKRERENKALDRLRKKRKVMDLPPLKATAKKNGAGASSFLLPRVDGKDVMPSIQSMDGFRRSWNSFVAKAKSVGGDEEEQRAFVRHHFVLSLAKNRASQADTAARNESVTCVVTV